MNENLVIFKASLTAFFAAVGAFLGWRVIMLIVWVALMALDYLSGTLAARQNGKAPWPGRASATRRA